MLADKAYSHPSTRTELRSEESNTQFLNVATRSLDARPKDQPAAARPHSTPLYGLRNTVERGFNRLKQWRGVATRYDKYALTYLGGVLLACAVIHARVGATELGRHALGIMAPTSMQLGRHLRRSEDR